MSQTYGFSLDPVKHLKSTFRIIFVCLLVSGSHPMLLFLAISV